MRSAGCDFFQASRDGPDLVFELERMHGMEASVSRSGVITAAHTRGGMATLERRTEFWPGKVIGSNCWIVTKQRTFSAPTDDIT